VPLFKGIPPALLFGVFVLTLYLAQPQQANAHGGGLNKCGCHIDSRYNTCHCHQAPYGGCGSECYSRFSPHRPEEPEQACAGDGRLGTGRRVVSYVEALALKEEEEHELEENKVIAAL
jgi:hypothetical protein